MDVNDKFDLILDKLSKVDKDINDKTINAVAPLSA